MITMGRIFNYLPNAQPFFKGEASRPGPGAQNIMTRFPVECNSDLGNRIA